MKKLSAVLAVVMTTMMLVLLPAQTATAKAAGCGRAPAVTSYYQSTFPYDIKIPYSAPSLNDPGSVRRSSYRVNVLTQYRFCDYVKTTRRDVIQVMATQYCITNAGDSRSRVASAISYDVLYTDGVKNSNPPGFRFEFPRIDPGGVFCSNAIAVPKEKKLLRDLAPRIYSTVQVALVGYRDYTFEMGLLGDKFRRIDPIIDFQVG